VDDLVLGIDIGTSSSQGVLARPDGEILAVCERPHHLSLSRPGWAEHDADAVWGTDFLAIYSWRRQERIDRRVEVGLSTLEKAELAAAKRRIRELEAELAVHRRAAELLRETSD
jgi:sugar (pentulose or hexulose) kinase